MGSFRNELRLSRWVRPPVATLVAFATVMLSTPADAGGRTEGEELVVTGVATDSSGLPVPGVTVELRGTRLAFSLRDFRIARRGGRTIRSTTDAGGNFELRWPWHPYYNRFELVAGVDLSGPSTPPRLDVLAATDVSKRIRHGSPVVVTFEIPDRKIVDELTAFLARLETPDERRVYQQMGKPDKVRDTTYADSRSTTWWYFAQGKVYRFEDGSMHGVEDFEPIGEIRY